MVENPTVRLSLAVAVTALTAAPSGVQAQTVRGTVTDPELGTPVAEALVIMVDGDGDRVASMFTDPDGTFALEAPRDGSYMLGVGRIGYQQAITPEFPVARSDVTVNIFLPPKPVTVDSLTVASRRNTPDAGRLRGLLTPERARGTLVARLSRAELEARSPQSDLIGLLYTMNVPGLTARRMATSSGGPPNAICIEVGRNRSVLSKTESRFQIGPDQRGDASGSILESQPESCDMLAVYIDDLYVVDPALELASISVADLDRLDVLPPLEALARYGARGANGALLLWTRRDP